MDEPLYIDNEAYTVPRSENDVVFGLGAVEIGMKGEFRTLVKKTPVELFMLIAFAIESA